MKLLIFDGNWYVKRAQHGFKIKMHRSDGMETTIIYGTLAMMCKDIELIQPTHIAVVFDGGGTNFRTEILPSYKATRHADHQNDMQTHDGMSIALFQQFQALIHGLKLLGLPVFHIRDTEADDVIATLARTTVCQVVIGTNDKDIMQLVDADGRVTIYNSLNKEFYDYKGVYTRVGVYPNQIHQLLTLCGDKVDEIEGCPGISLATGKRILNSYGSVGKFLSQCTEGKDFKHVAQIRACRVVKRNRKLTALAHIELDLTSNDLQPKCPSADFSDWLKLYDIRKAPHYVQVAMNQSKVRTLGVPSQKTPAIFTHEVK